MARFDNQTRSGRKPNPADPRTTLTTDMGSTYSGGCAALKVLHPCGEYDLDAVKIPDGAVSTSVVLERRDEYEIRTSSVINDDPSWTCLVIHQPFLIHRDLVLRWPSRVTPTDMQLYNMIAAINKENIYDSDATPPTAGVYPNFRFGSTLTGIPAADPYTVIEYSVLTSSTFTPALLQGRDVHSSLYKDVRRTAAGYTTDLDASELYNQGRVVSGQWTPSVTKGIVDQVGSAASPTEGADPVSVVVNAFDTWDYLAPAVSSSNIVSSDMFRRQAEAKYGSYMPIRLCSADVCFQSASSLRQINTLPPGGNAVTTVSAQYNADDIHLCGWSVGVELWLNLDPHAELRMKVVEDLELDPAPTSTFSPFMSPGYPRDDRALTVMREFARISPHAYDADFNRLNKMFTNLINGLGGVLSGLGIPVLSNVAKPLASAITDKWGYRAPLPRGVPNDMGQTMQ